MTYNVFGGSLSLAQSQSQSERVVDIRLLSNRISNVISNYDYCLQEVIVTK